MQAFSNENFELKVYLKYILDKSRYNKYKKCLIDYINDQNVIELQKFLDKYEFTYINLTRLVTQDQELIPLMQEFIALYKSVEDLVNELVPDNEIILSNDNTDRMSYNEIDEYIDNKEKSVIKKKLIKEERNDNNE